jgi:hypothetical protein
MDAGIPEDTVLSFARGMSIAIIVKDWRFNPLLECLCDCPIFRITIKSIHHISQNSKVQMALLQRKHQLSASLTVATRGPVAPVRIFGMKKISTTSCPVCMSQGDRATLAAAMRTMKAARDATMEYFYGRMEKVKAGFEDCNDQMREWHRVVEEVLSAGKDPVYNEHKEREGAAARDWENAFAFVSGKCPWLASAKSFFSGFGDSAERVEQIVKNAYTDAVDAFFREEHKDEIEALRAELESHPQELSPSAFPVGAVIFSELRGMPGTFRITRHTHNGRRTLATNGAGEVVRLPEGRRGDGYLSPGRGYRLVSQEWADRNAALNALWISERRDT